MKQEDFKSGDIILVDENDKRLVIQFEGSWNSTNGLAVVGDDHYQPLGSFLSHNKEFTVYRPDSNYSLSNGIFNQDCDFTATRNFEKVYDGEEIKEVTLEEVAKAMNINVKSLRIKE